MTQNDVMPQWLDISLAGGILLLLYIDSTVTLKNRMGASVVKENYRVFLETGAPHDCCSLVFYCLSISLRTLWK